MVAPDATNNPVPIALAKLLYQVGFHAEAIAEQQRAVELYKPQKRHYKRMQDVLKQMRDGSWSGS